MQSETTLLHDINKGKLNYLQKKKLSPNLVQDIDIYHKCMHKNTSELFIRRTLTNDMSISKCQRQKQMFNLYRPRSIPRLVCRYDFIINTFYTKEYVFSVRHESVDCITSNFYAEWH